MESLDPYVVCHADNHEVVERAVESVYGLPVVVSESCPRGRVLLVTAATMLEPLDEVLDA